MSKDILTIHIKTLSQQHQLSGVAKPKHLLFSILRFEDFPKLESEQRIKLISAFYQITLKKDCACKLKYGQTQYDFDKGVMSFFSPGQISIIEPGDVLPASGWVLFIHPDFLRSFSLSQKIKSYGFFDYAVNEALILSDDEQKFIEQILEQIEKEYQLPIDNFSQEVIISNLELLLTYCNRYYNRPFITRKTNNSELLNKVNKILSNYFEKANENGLPTATYVASQLNLSPNI